MQQIHFKIPNGYQICERKREVDIDTAVALLSTRQQKKYSGAYPPAHGLTAELVRHVLVCPHCGHEIPAYAKYMNTVFSGSFRASSTRISKAIIAEWGAKQVSFFEPTYTELKLNPVCRPTGIFHCPKCEQSSEPYKSMRDIYLTRTDHCIKISCEVQGLEELLSLPWYSANQVLLRLPLFETYTFNLYNGHTFVEVGSLDGESIFAKRDMTAFPDMMENCLADWTPRDNPVVAIKRWGYWIGAIEVHDQLIIQAHGCCNSSSSYFPDFDKAYDKWKKKYGLTDRQNAFCMEFDDDFEMPF